MSELDWQVMPSSQKLCIERSVQDSHHYFPLTPSLYHFFNHWLTALHFTHKNNVVWVLLKCHRMKLLWSLMPNTIYISTLCNTTMRKEHYFFFFFFFYFFLHKRRVEESTPGYLRECPRNKTVKLEGRSCHRLSPQCREALKTLTKTLIEIMLIE